MIKYSNLRFSSSFPLVLFVNISGDVLLIVLWQYIWLFWLRMEVDYGLELLTESQDNVM